MPQLDKISFFSQFFYLITVLIILYICIRFVIFPKLITTLLIRKKIKNLYYNCNSITIPPLIENLNHNFFVFGDCFIFTLEEPINIRNLFLTTSILIKLKNLAKKIDNKF